MKIRIDDTVHNIINQYCLPTYLKKSYLESYCTLLTDPPVYIPDDEQCQTCGAYKVDMPGKRLTLCSSFTMNSKAGYVLKICVFCQYWFNVHYEHYGIDMVPAKIRNNMQRPRHLDTFLHA